MKNGVKISCLVAALAVGSCGFPAAQGGSTDSRGNAMGSERVGNGTPSAAGGAMQHQGTQGTTGMNTKRSEQGSPNGSPNAAPTSKQGPGGDPSKNNGRT